MAEPVALGVKPPQGMSLGDMLNIARGAQAYQQEQQMNPLALQKAQAEANVATGTEKPRISQATSQAETARIEALKANYGLDESEHSAFAKILGGFAYDKRLSPEEIKKNPQGVLDVIHDMKAEGRASGIREKRLDTITSPAMAKALQDPNSVPQYLQNMMMRGMTPSEQRGAGVEKVEPTAMGQVIRTKPSVYGQQPQVSYESPQGITPAPSIVELNGVKYEVRPPKVAGGSNTLVPLGGGQTPNVTTPNQPAPSQPTANAPSATTPPQSLVPLDMPVSGTGIPQMNTQQKDRYDAGKKLIEDASKMSETAAESRQTVRQIKQNIGEASGSRIGQVIRNAGKWVAGNEKLDELTKSLADNQLRQAQMMGINTDAARSTSALANGSENITIGALNMIANRADATSTAFEKYNIGLDNFQKKHGAYNGMIHADNFQRAWKKNYDPMIFMIQNINASQMTDMQKKMEIDALKSGVSKDKLEKLQQKAEIIKRLERGDF
jgi:hypothetical protein